MKRTLSIALLVFLLTGVFVFGAGQSEQPAKKQKTAALNYLTWRFSKEDYQPALDQFESENPGIRVNFQQISNVEPYLQAQKVRLLSEEVDITSIRPESITDYQEAGYLMDISGEPYLSNFVDGTLRWCTINDAVYAIPGGINLIAVWYNKDMFEQFGLTTPANYEEYIKVLETFKKSDIYPMACGGKDVWPMEFDTFPFFHKLLLDDEMVFDKIDKGELKYTDDFFIETLNDVDAFFEKGYMHPDVLSLSYDQAINFFVQQRVPMLNQGEWATLNIDEARPDFEVGVFPIVVPEHGTDIVVPVSVGYYQAGISSTRHPEAVKKWLEFDASPWMANFLLETIKAFSPVKGIEAEIDSSLMLWKDLLQYRSVDFFYSLQYPGANSELLKGLQDIFVDARTPEEVAEAVQNAQEKKE